MPNTLLFLDVDGPLLPFGGNHPPTSPPRAEHRDTTSPLISRLDRTLGPRLTALPCELIWATTWMDEANHTLGPLLNLPVLPVVPWPTRTDDPVDTWYGLHWKTRPLLDYAATRPFIWLDDEITPRDTEYASTHHPAPSLLHRVNPRTGLGPTDFEILATWLTTHRGQGVE
ncbi:hypothetical protein [Nocardia sp. NPDC057668]|uniref:hypothetical protein n=1 Tax=Nocardia sp. NPDC057668 TaxID=3346202 RepID=UPI00366F56A4